MTRFRSLSALTLFSAFAIALPAAAATTEFRVLFDVDRSAATGCEVAGMAGVDQVLVTRVENGGDAAAVMRTFRHVCIDNVLGQPLDESTSEWPAGFHAQSGALLVETRVAADDLSHNMRVGVQATHGSASHVVLTRADGSPLLFPTSSARKRRTVAPPGDARVIALDGDGDDWQHLTPLIHGIAASGNAAIRMSQFWGFADSADGYLYFRFDAHMSAEGPVASDDSYVRPDSGALEVPAPGVLQNDDDPSGAPLTALPAADPRHGTLALHPDGSFTYTPNDAASTESDIFEYRASNGAQTSNTARVVISVATADGAPVGADDAYDATENVELGVAAPGVLLNDSDPNGDPLTAILLAAPQHGTVVLSADGGFTYTPAAGYSGSDAFTYIVNDGTQTDTARVTITITATNDAPVANAQSLTVAEDGEVAITLTGSDADGDALTFIVAANPAHGTLSGTPPSLTYTAATHYDGPDSFTFTASDGTATSPPAEVSITVTAVDDTPFANDDVYGTLIDTPLDVAAPGVITNDHDVEGAAMSAVLATDVVNGTLTLAANGSFHYVPASGFTGTDTFTYRTSDGNSLSTPATVTINVRATNSAPLAEPQSVSVDEDGAVAITLQGSDADGDILGFAIETSPAHGTLAGTAPDVVYTPDADYNGSDSFTFTASDGFATSAAATVSITVDAINDAPSPANDLYGTPLNTAIAIAAPGVLANDGDADGDSLTATLVSGPSNGTLTLHGDGSFEYVPADGFSGSDTFTYRASDAIASADATVTINVSGATNTAPVANAQSVDVNEDASIAITLTAGDAEGNSLSFAVGTSPVHGTLSGTAPNLTYTPDADYNGSDSFTFTATDGIATSAQAAVTIDVAAVNDAPVANDDVAGTTEDIAVSGNVLTNDTDVEGDTFTSVLDSNVSNGTLVFGSNGDFTYTPAPGFTGNDQFSYHATDGDDSNVAIVTIVVSDDPPPVANADAYSVDEGETLNGTSVLANDTEATNDPLTAVLVEGPQRAAAFTFNADGTFTYTHDGGQSPTDTFTYFANDGAANSNSVTVTITIHPRNDAPLFTSAPAQSVFENTTAASIVTASDADGDAVTLAITGGSDAPRFTFDNATGVLSFAAAPDFEAPVDAGTNNVYDLVLTATDGNGGTATQNLTITVTNRNEPPLFTIGTTASIAENSTADILTVTATDPEGGSVTFTEQSGFDSSYFQLSAGTLSFFFGPDFEEPIDTNHDNVYLVALRATDGSGLPTDQLFEVTVTNVDEAPLFISDPGFAVFENQTAVGTVAAFDGDSPALMFAISGGADAAKFSIDASTGVLTFIAAPNFEVPGDAGGDNVYELDVTVTDGTNPAVQNVIVTVMDGDDPSVITSPSTVSVPENTTAILTVTATDVDAGATLQYNISGGSDAHHFTINPATGALSFILPHDFEQRQDSNFNNDYVVIVTVNSNPASQQTITVNVTDVNEAPEFANPPAASRQEFSSNFTVVGVVFAFDPENANVTIAIAAGADAARFTFDTDTNLIGFTGGADFEAPSDANGDNVYEVTMSASDGTNVTLLPMTLTIIDRNETPQFTSSVTVFVPENTTAVGTVAATDPESAPLTYTMLPQHDFALLTLDPVTGVLTFNDPPDFETPGSAFGSNLYFALVQVTDGVNVSTRAQQVVITDVNEAPSLAPAAFTVLETATVAGTMTGTDPDQFDSQAWSISGGADAARFSIHSASGTLFFTSAPDFEAPTDADGNNVYEVEVTLTDNLGLTATGAVQVTVTNLNEAPQITPVGPVVPENTTAAGTLTATDPEGDPVTWSIAGGVDAAKLQIDNATGALSFLAAPDFEAPGDADADGLYEVTIGANDGSETGQLHTIVAVINVDETLFFTTGTSFSVTENTTAVTTVDADDPENVLITYSISGGADAALFAIHAFTGALTFAPAPDFEAPGDAGANNVYEVEVAATDSTFTVTQTLEVTVTNSIDAPFFTGSDAFDAPENATAAGTVTASDHDGETLTFSISGGDDATLFSIDSSTGVLTFNAPQDRETEADADSDGVYDVTIGVTDGTQPVTRTYHVTVTDVNEAPFFVSGATLSVAENVTAIGVIDADDPEGDALTFSLDGGADAASFSIDTDSGALSFTSARNFEAPSDADQGNSYEVNVEISDGVHSDTRLFTVGVTNVNEPPLLVGVNVSNVQENTTACGTIAATDPDGDALTFSIQGNGPDPTFFSIDPSTGVLTFNSPPDYENPTDFMADHVYVFSMFVSDGSLDDSWSHHVFVHDVNEPPVFTSSATATVAENATTVVTLTATDPESQPVTFSVTGGADAALFEIIDDGGNKTLKFIAAPDFDIPGDDDSDNIYDVEVTASDGGETAVQTLEITVTAENEPMVVTSPNISYDVAGNTQLRGGSPASPSASLAFSAADDIFTKAGIFDPDDTVTLTSVTPDGGSSGSITFDADGSFTFLPDVGTTAAQTFSYSVTNGSTTANGTITFNISGMVWYVANDVAGPGSGLSTDPFQELSDGENDSDPDDAEDAAGDDHIIYVAKGDGTPAHYDAGIELKSGQQLIGAASDLVVGSATLVSGVEANRPQISAAEVQVVRLGSDNTIKGLTIAAPVDGTGITNNEAASFGTASIDDVSFTGSGAFDLVSGTGTINVADSTINTAGFSSVSLILDSPSMHFTNTPISHSGGLPIRIDGVTDGSMTFDAASPVTVSGGENDGVPQYGIDVQSLTNYDVTFNGNVTVTGDATAAGGVSIASLDASSLVTFAGDLAITTSDSTGMAIANATVDVAAVGTTSIETTDARAFVSTAGSGTIVFDNVTASGAGVVSGVSLTNSTGTFNAAAGSLTGASDAFVVSGGNANITYGGSIAGGAGDAVDIANTTGGSITLSGDIAGGSGRVVNLSGNNGTAISFGGNFSQPAGTSTGIRISGNSGTITFGGASVAITTGANPALQILNDTATVNFTLGGLVINTTSGAGLTMTSAGPLNVLLPGNSITTTSGAAVHITGSTFGAENIRFDSVSSDGSASGIIITDSGGPGYFIVTGTFAGVGSGGTIQNTTGPAVSLSNATNVSLRGLNVTNSGGHGIDLANVTSFGLEDAAITNAGNASGEHAINIVNLFGAFELENVTLDEIVHDGIRIRQNAADDASQDLLSITELHVLDHEPGGESGIDVAADLASDLYLFVQDSDFTINNGTMAIRASTPATNTQGFTLDLRGNTFDGSAAAGSGTVAVSGGGSGTVLYTMDGNEITGTNGVGLSFLIDGPGLAFIDLLDNVLQGSSVDSVEGIEIEQSGLGSVRTKIERNTITQFASNAIHLTAVSNHVDGSDASMELSATISDNSTGAPAANGAGLLIEVGNGAGSRNDVCADISSNTFIGSKTTPGVDDDIVLVLNEAVNVAFNVRQTSAADLSTANNGAQVGIVEPLPGSITFDGGACP